MTRLIVNRLLILPVLVLGISFVVFFTLHLIPGNPAEVLAGGVFATPEEVARIERQYGLDRPLLSQYLTYVENVARGDFGESLFARRSVAAELRDRVPASIELSFFALLIGTPLGLLFGVYSALRRDTSSDYILTGLSLVGLSIPSFILALLLAWLFAVKLQWFPLSGQLGPFESVERITGFVTVDAVLTGNWQGLRSALWHLALPALTVAVIPLAVVARYTRATFIEVLHEDYIRTARAYGLPPRQILWVYTAKNAMLPLVTLFGILVPAILVGSVLVETVFAWPGIGTLIVNAITARDYAVVQSVTLVVAVSYVLLNLLIDISYAFLDPRVRGR